MASKKPEKNTLPPKQARFVEEYLIDCNGTQAAIRAGYSAHTANEQAAQLLAKLSVQKAVQEAKARLQERTQVSAEWVIAKLVENVERASQAKPVLDKEGKPTGDYAYRGDIVNKGLELLARHLGLFVDKQEIQVNGSLAEKLERAKKRVQNMRNEVTNHG